MPGPSNSHKKRKSGGKREKERRGKPRASLDTALIAAAAANGDINDDTTAVDNGSEGSNSRLDDSIEETASIDGSEAGQFASTPLSTTTTASTPGAQSTESQHDATMTLADDSYSRHPPRRGSVSPPITTLHTPRLEAITSPPSTILHKHAEAHDPTLVLLQHPMIHDPGNGPRVRDVRAFLASSFAHPPYTADPLCAEFAQPEVFQMLCTVLPEETALFLWYNKSRKTGRICPACRRLYCLGDALPDPMHDPYEQAAKKEPSPRLLAEQQLSGLCSPLCFILASFNYPGAIRSTWGRVAQELDDATWALLDGPGGGQPDLGLSMLLKMTRLHDLGLAQLCVPDSGIDEEIYDQSSPEDEKIATHRPVTDTLTPIAEFVYSTRDAPDTKPPSSASSLRPRFRISSTLAPGPTALFEPRTAPPIYHAHRPGLDPRLEEPVWSRPPRATPLTRGAQWPRSIAALFIRQASEHAPA
ncbi:hypothetical protein HETIRDRAFT_452848 [Heterobasidion irregulare TC 32-1]|uniref:Uncharacterized protein n=1 Tax=Heterobasidion irregulare (strain TC 32-1) TaxID=747525 RepID=W4K1Q7_HETIT|nr:uncharacterized protein HETIRDRAFT_452848 [Heterobasidion irregulare TC 32-1]ETW79758.1 hypothetical protein HETIRDRAFT_452848 [Heterobasidion irregulare TC 32-1]